MMEKIGIFVVAFVVLCIPALLLNGWAFMVLWEWFVVPTANLRALSFGEALGMSLVVSYVTSGSPSFREKTTAEAFKSLAWIFAKPLISLGVGWAYIAVFF